MIATLARVRASRPAPARGVAGRRLLPFIGATAVLLAAWLLLALLYRSLPGPARAVDTRDLVLALSSSPGRSGQVESTAILGVPEYFRAIKLDPAALGAGAGSLPVIINLDTHSGELPAPEAWAPSTALAQGGETAGPIAASRVLTRSEHHQSVALLFPQPRLGAQGDDVPATLRLTVPPLESGAEPAVLSWSLPLSLPTTDASRTRPRPAASLAALLAAMAGLLVVFSPCALHMSGVFLPLITGMSMPEVKARASDVRFRARTLALAMVFVSGFVLLYTAFGMAAGAAGRLLSDTAALRPYLVPVRTATGLIVIYLALQALGFFRLPFIVSLQLPGKPQVTDRRPGYLAAFLAGLNVSAGCLACVGGSLLAAMLLYAGVSGSAWTGGATLFLFSVGVSAPFLLIALAFDRVLPRLRSAWGLLRHSTVVAAAVMLVVGLLIMSGGESIVERLALGIAEGH